jgi:uncharacterized protein
MDNETGHHAGAAMVRRITRMTFAVVVGFALVVVTLLLVFQRSLIYYPRRYDPNYVRGLPPGTARLEWSTPAGRQHAFYIGPHRDATTAPEQLWVLFTGNASIALDWLSFTEQCRDERIGFLLVDYPGYGDCAGKPGRDAIRECAEAAFDALIAHLHLSAAELDSRVNVLGLSIGCAAGLEFALRHGARRIVLLAPFTSLLDMARLSVGIPLCYLLYDRFDNRARLAELAHRADRPQVNLFHGTDDEIVPFRMGKELADAHPGMIRFHPVPRATHNTILDIAEHEILAVMSGAPTSESRGNAAGPHSSRK